TRVWYERAISCTVRAMTLPHAENATVPESKCTQYLLDIHHAEGGRKAKFFLSHGYTIKDWHLLAGDLRFHGRTYPVSSQRATVSGVNYGVIGPLRLPD